MYLSVYMDVLGYSNNLKNTKTKKKYIGGVLRFTFNKLEIIIFSKASRKN